MTPEQFKKLQEYVNSDEHVVVWIGRIVFNIKKCGTDAAKIIFLSTSRDKIINIDGVMASNFKIIKCETL